MTRINSKEVRLLINEVISNAVKTLAEKEFRVYTRYDKIEKKTYTYSSVPTTNNVEVKALAVTFKRFVAKTAKEVKVFVERTYDRSKRDYYTTVYVLVDNKPELFLPSTFVNRVIDAI